MQKQGKAASVKRISEAKSRTKAETKKRPRSPKIKSRSQPKIDDINTDSDQNDITEFAPGVWSLDPNPKGPKTWKEAPKRISTSDGRAYIKHLHPQPNPPNSTELIVEWLSKVS